VLFDGDQAVGTSGLMRSGLETRPDLMPWLGGLYVEPAFRGHATALVRQVEDAARTVPVSTLWLYTPSADGLYLRLGWQHVGVEQEDGRDVVLMRRDLFQDRLPGRSASAVVQSRPLLIAAARGADCELSERNSSSGKTRLHIGVALSAFGKAIVAPGGRHGRIVLKKSPIDIWGVLWSDCVTPRSLKRQTIFIPIRERIGVRTPSADFFNIG
jgi:hypothetical protein